MAAAVLFVLKACTLRVFSHLKQRRLRWSCSFTELDSPKRQFLQLVSELHEVSQVQTQSLEDADGIGGRALKITTNEEIFVGGCKFLGGRTAGGRSFLRKSKVQRDSLFGNFGDGSKVKGAGN